MDHAPLRPPKKVKTRLLLAATGAVVLSITNCGPATSGNLLAPGDSGTPSDAGKTDAGVKNDGGTDGGP